MQKRGQIAQEFIITYGWIILVILSFLWGLAYYDVINLDTFISEKCTFSAGFECLDYSWQGTTFSVTIQNGLGFDVQNISMDLDPDVNGIIRNVSDYQEEIGMLNTESRMFVYNCTNLGTISTFQSTLHLYFETGLTDVPHNKIGVLVVKKEG